MRSLRWRFAVGIIISLIALWLTTDAVDGITVAAGPTEAAPTPSAAAASAGTVMRLYLPGVHADATPTPAPTPTAVPYVPPSSEVRAVWVSRYDWTQSGQTPSAADVQAVVDDAARGGFNAIFFQVRGAGDAYYRSSLEPWAARLTGTNGDSLGTDPGWDPLAEMIARAHARGIAVHAWFNVYPAWQAPTNGEETVPRQNINPPAPLYRMSWSSVPNGTGEDTPGYGLGNDWRAHDINGPMSAVASPYLWASPNCPAWRDYVVAVVQDVVARYEVDGVHLDNVRFPSVAYSLDPYLSAACAADPACTGGVHDDAWRGAYQRAQVTEMVRRITQAAHALRPGIMVSAAVMPIYQNYWGWSGEPSYSTYYQDSQAWLQNGDVDALVPMLYTYTFYDTNWTTREWHVSMDRWQTATADFRDHSGGRAVIPGIGITREGFGCVPFAEIQAQVDAARSLGTSGYAAFSLSGLRTCGYLDAMGAAAAQ